MKHSQAPLSMGFPRQEYQSGLHFLIQGGLPDPGLEPKSLVSPAWQGDSLPLSYLGSPSLLSHVTCNDLANNLIK